jgi:hypothetical protein
VDVREVPLSKWILIWKGKSSRLANITLGRCGKFWQEDYFDTLIRDEEHLKRARLYTERNPAKGAMVLDPRDWKWGSARRRDKYERLPWQVMLG